MKEKRLHIAAFAVQCRSVSQVLACPRHHARPSPTAGRLDVGNRGELAAQQAFWRSGASGNQVPVMTRSASAWALAGTRALLNLHL